MVDKFIGRKTELAALQEKFDSKGFHMAVIYGRRRLGKTALINEFIRLNDVKAISFVALERTEKELLEMMGNTVLTELAPELLDVVHFESFDKIFDFLAHYAKNEKIIFVIDEYPYLAQQCKYMNSLLQKYIDHQWKETQMFFIICGSLVSFMRDDVLSKNAPLHGRSSIELKLRPFDYLETADFVPKFSNEDKAIVYGLTGGVAKYLEQFDDSKSLDTNIIKNFFSNTGYFTEEQVKTVITGEKSSPTTYNSIISAIANGHTKHNEIGTASGIDDISYSLKVLQESELIEKRFSSGKPYYVITDGMLYFWFKYVSKAASLINAGRGDEYYNRIVKKDLHNFMGKVFENIAKQYVFMNMCTDKIPAFITDITDYQTSYKDEKGNIRQVEIDIVGKNEKSVELAAECKFRNEKFDKDELESFLNKVNYLPAKNVFLILFSLSGFTEYVQAHSKDILLVDINDMYS